MKSAFFCAKCGRMLAEFEEHGKQEVVCTCGHVQLLRLSMTAGEKLPTRESIGKGVMKPARTASFPHTCKKCGYRFSEPTQLSASYSDESDIVLYRCKKCGFVERQADGSGNC